MKFLIVLLLTAFAFGCATSNKAQQVVQTKSGRTIAQANMAPGQKLNFYSCKSGLMQGAKTIDKTKCELVSDINIGTVLSGQAGNANTITSLEEVSAKTEGQWVKCDGEDNTCISNGTAWDWEKTSHFNFNESQSNELVQKLKAAYSNNKGVAVYFNKNQVKKALNGDQQPMHIYGLKDANVVIEPN